MALVHISNPGITYNLFGTGHPPPVHPAAQDGLKERGDRRPALRDASRSR